MDARAALSAAHQVTVLLRDLMADRQATDALDVLVGKSRDVLSFDGCSITLKSDQGARTVSSTDDNVLHADTLQYQFDEGPCLDAMSRDDRYVINDLSTDSRWPRWGPPAEELGIASMLSIRLVGERTRGSLNLYAGRPRTYNPEELMLGEVLAAQAGMVLNTIENHTNLRAGLDGRTVIGQAVGIFMERYELDSDAAFATLRRLSMDNNVKIRTLAEEIVRSRRLPFAGAEDG